MITDVAFKTVGGLGLFLFGMGQMSDGLKKVAGQKLRSLLESLTRQPIVAVLVGALVTCLIQSSSAATVMTVGFVNAGLLNLKNALCVVLGANVGTTFTAWLVSGLGIFEVTAYALPAVAAGFLIQALAKHQQGRSMGQIILGFGLLFVGIAFMKDAFSPLQDSQRVQQVLIWVGHNRILAVIAGTVITMLLQSSSASIAIIQMLAFTGAFGSDWTVALTVALPFILGDNIGTTITAQIAALQTSRNAKRVAWGHTIFNILGVCYILPLVWTGLFVKFVIWVTPGELSKFTVMMHIAVAHSLFNVFNTVIFLPVIKWLEVLVIKIIPLRENEIGQKPVILEERLLHTPAIALQQAKREIIRMAKRAKRAVNEATDGFANDDMKCLDRARKTEDIIDTFQYEITSYLVRLSQGQLNDEVSIELPVLLHMVNDLERVGDHAVNITEIAERKIANKFILSDNASLESREMVDEVLRMLDGIITALKNNDRQAAHSALASENKLNRMQVDLRRSHIQRMTDGTCDAQAGLIFIDLVDNLEKIGDHLTNIAQSVIGGVQWAGIDTSTLSGEYKAITSN
ncbi:MAG TPA: Na/Pi cotransporter family protein [Planctomycetes bacterium]|nr:Na/Pi cotransporter family protein [Planctomycetota bacterium]HIJ71549.1 Na/Pi cotransporter family protein [Planctomycetota bacterium]